MYRAAVIVLALFSTVAEAAPVNLKCQVDGDLSGSPKTREIDVTLNEDAGTVSISLPGYNLDHTVRGMFAADKVTFKDDGVGYIADYTVDRTNLAFRESVLREADASRIASGGETSAESVLQQMDRARVLNRGKCTLVHAKRAF